MGSIPMLVLHAAFHEGCLHLWGESSPPEEAPKTKNATAYPYYTSSAALPVAKIANSRP